MDSIVPLVRRRILKSQHFPDIWQLNISVPFWNLTPATLRRSRTKLGKGGGAAPRDCSFRVLHLAACILDTVAIRNFSRRIWKKKVSLRRLVFCLRGRRYVPNSILVVQFVSLPRLYVLIFRAMDLRY